MKAIKKARKTCESHSITQKHANQYRIPVETKVLRGALLMQIGQYACNCKKMRAVQDHDASAITSLKGRKFKRRFRHPSARRQQRGLTQLETKEPR
jgi:phosphate-selective porin